MSSTVSVPIIFDCEGSRLLGVIERGRRETGVAVLIVTGGPQYRVGSHRQFVDIARKFAGAGISTMRFDYRGMGDSDGPPVTFDTCMGDIRAAIDVLIAESGVRKIVLWGLCDAASACLIYGYQDERVSGMILANPWVRTEQGMAQTYVKKYYGRQLVSGEFWARLLRGKVELLPAVTELLRNILTGYLPVGGDRAHEIRAVAEDFRKRMLVGFENANIPMLFLLCGEDLTAAEFDTYCGSLGRWRSAIARANVAIRRMPGMDHTFSNLEHRREVIAHCLEWLRCISDCGEGSEIENIDHLSHSI